MKGKRIVAVAATVVVLGTAWAGWRWMSGPSAAARAKVDEIHQKFEAARKLPPEQGRRQMDDLRKQIDELPDEERQLLREEGRQRMEKEMERRHQEMEKRIKDFFALPVAQRTAALDKHIDEMERMRQAWQQRRPPGGGPPGGQQRAGAPGSRPPGGRNSVQRQARRLNPDFQVSRQVRRLNHSTPETRTYFTLLQERRRQRGLPEFGPPRGPR